MQGNGLQSGPQNLASHAIANPFVAQYAADPAWAGKGGGSAYTVDVLNSLNPLGVQANQYPHMNAPAAPAAASPFGGLTPFEQKFLHQQFFEAPQMGPRGDRFPGIPVPAWISNPSVMQRMGIWNPNNMIAPGHGFAPGTTNQQAANDLGITIPQGQGMGMNGQPPSAIPIQNMAHNLAGKPFPAMPSTWVNPFPNPGNRQPAKAAPAPNHYMGLGGGYR
jgi:hypothetical protein